MIKSQPETIRSLTRSTAASEQMINDRRVGFYRLDCRSGAKLAAHLCLSSVEGVKNS